MLSPSFYLNEKRLGAFALLYNLTNITVEFDGGGDSGCIEDVSVECGNPESFDTDTLITVFMPGDRVFVPGTGWLQEEGEFEREVPFDEFIHNHVEEALDEAGVDWYNNDGGYGAWSWDPQNGVDFNIEVRVTESETVYSEERTLGYPVGEDDEDGDEHEDEDSEAKESIALIPR